MTGGNPESIKHQATETRINNAKLNRQNNIPIAGFDVSCDGSQSLNPRCMAPVIALKSLYIPPFLKHFFHVKLLKSTEAPVLIS